MINLSKEELDFLIELQHEMLTQDTVCQAAPRFWVVEDKRSVPTAEEYADDGFEIYDSYGCETVASSMEELITYINEKYNHKGLAVFYDNGDAILIRLNRPIEEDDTLDSFMKDGELSSTDKNGEEVESYADYLTIESFVEELNDIPFVSEELNVVYMREEEFIAPNTMFLTNRSAKQHIEANHYHYHKDAHSYAMTAWRSPEVEKLWAILDKINWKELKEEKYGTGKEADESQSC